MHTLGDRAQPVYTAEGECLPISVVIAVRNEARNLPRCLDSLRGVGEIYVIDSQSTDDTVEIARSAGAKVAQFFYRGGWPKKRQWAMDTLPLAYDWILLVDADELMTAKLRAEIGEAIKDPSYDGYYLGLRMQFMGRMLRHGGAAFYKLALFRRGRGRFECRLRDQNGSMCDMEVHEHILVRGRTRKLRNPLLHHNAESLERYIQKHNEYSNWESRMLLQETLDSAALPASLLGSQAQRRRWIKQTFFRLPGASVLLFLYRYVLRLGFADGVAGLIYCTFQAIQMFHTKAKIYESRLDERSSQGRPQTSIRDSGISSPPC